MVNSQTLHLPVTKLKSRRYLRGVLRDLSTVSSWCFYFCWLLRMVVEVALARKIQVQIFGL